MMCAVCWETFCVPRHNPNWDRNLKRSERARRQKRDWRGRFTKTVDIPTTTP